MLNNKKTNDLNNLSKIKVNKSDLLLNISNGQSNGKRNDELVLKYSNKTFSDLTQTRKKLIRLNERFHKLFPSITSNERVLESYSCAYIKSLNIYHGLMFLTSNFICFYSKIMKHETCLVFKLASIQTIAKCNYALLFPTAIKIDTDKSSYLFSSFRSRQQTYDNLIELWNVSLRKQVDEETLTSIENNHAKQETVSEEFDNENEESQQVIFKIDSISLISTISTQLNVNSIDNEFQLVDQPSNTKLNDLKHNYFCRTSYDLNRSCFSYDYNFSQYENSNLITVSLRQKKSIVQKARILLGLLIPGFSSISRIDSLLPMCFLMCLLLLLNAFVLLNKVNQVDELFSQLLDTSSSS